MSGILTAAGIKLCAAVLGVSQPNYDDCNKAIFTLSIPCDRWWRCPMKLGSSPNSMRKPGDPEGYECIDWAEYDIFDGSKGTSYVCWRPAKFIFDPVTATFRWELQ